MGVGYVLVNRSQNEWISFAHLPASKVRELAGNPVTAAITTWYLLHHSSDQVAFVSDSDGRWPFAAGEIADLENFKDVTDSVIDQLIAAGILRDDGIAWADDEEPHEVFIRKLTNVWMDR